MLDAEGEAIPPAGLDRPGDDVLVELHRKMVAARRFDTQATALTRQGRLAVYPSAHGQEASQIGAVLALRPPDWLFPTYRDSMAVVARGVDPVEVLTLLRGDWHCGYDPYEHKVAPQCTPLATSALHAVGLAHAARLKGEDTTALAGLDTQAEGEAAALRDRMNTGPVTDPADLFRHVYAEPTPALRGQQQELFWELAQAGDAAEEER